MTMPCPVFPGTFYKLTRRCTHRQFLMRPDDTTNNNYLYCLGVAATKYNIVLILSQMMSNHHHTVAYDPDGNINEFNAYFHKLFATVQNRYRGRDENFWDTAPPCKVELIGIDAVLDKLTYAATNPVKDGLVEKVHLWPGPNTTAALMTGKSMTATRPRYFFSEHSKMPATIEVTFRFPEILGSSSWLKAELARRIAQAEAKFAAERLQTGRRVLGRKAILRQHWEDSPSGHVGRRKRDDIRPRVATRSKWERVAALQRNRVFIAAYQKARADWLASIPTVFPAGTYWLKRFANVPVAT